MQSIDKIEKQALLNLSNNSTDYKAMADLAFARGFNGHCAKSMQLFDASIQCGGREALTYFSRLHLVHNKLLYFPGFNEKLNQFAYKNYKVFIPHVAHPNTLCVVCGSSAAIWEPSRVYTDFDPSIIGDDIFLSFVSRSIGVCQSCGLYQNYQRMNQEQINEYIQTVTSKDMTVSEEAFHSYPVPPQFLDEYENIYYRDRLRMWGALFDKFAIKPRKCLFLRPFFGAPIGFIESRCDADCDFIEISDICRRTVLDRFPSSRNISINIHGTFFPDFSHLGKYDVIFCYHSLIHAIDPILYLINLKKLLTENGVIIFSDEINVKPHNPFHMNYWDENKFISTISSHFRKIVRINGCNNSAPPFVTNFTNLGDSPDFAAFI